MDDYEVDKVLLKFHSSADSTFLKLFFIKAASIYETCLQALFFSVGLETEISCKFSGTNLFSCTVTYKTYLKLKFNAKRVRNVIRRFKPPIANFHRDWSILI